MFKKTKKKNPGCKNVKFNIISNELKNYQVSKSIGNIMPHNKDGN